MAEYVKYPIDLSRGIYDYVGTAASPTTDLPLAVAGSTYRNVAGGSGSMFWQKTTGGWEALAASASGITLAFADGRYAQLAASNTMTADQPFVFNNATQNWLTWAAVGVAMPTFTTRSAGTKMVLYPAINSSNVDYALGVGSGTLWYSVPATGSQFLWFAGTTSIASLSGAGTLQLAQHLIIPSTKAVYLDGGSDTFIYEASANKIEFVAGAALYFRVNGAAAFVEVLAADFMIPATKKLYIDGGSNTYFVESSSDVISVFTGGSAVGQFNSSGITSGAHFIMPSLSKFFLDGGSDTYIVESAANQVDLVTGGVVNWRASSTSFALNARDFLVDATKKVYLDGGSDTYIYEQAANVLDMVVGGTLSLHQTTTLAGFSANVDFYIQPTKKFFLDGGSDTYIYESAANEITGIVGATTAWRVSTTLFAIGGAKDFTIDPLKRLYLDGGTDTYLVEITANQVQLIAGNALVWNADSSKFVIPATSRLYLDGFGDTYIFEASANVIRFFAGGVAILDLSTSAVFSIPIVVNSGTPRLDLTAQIDSRIGGNTMLYGHANPDYTNALGALNSGGHPYSAFAAYQTTGDGWKRSGSTTYPAAWLYNMTTGFLGLYNNAALGTANAAVTLSLICGADKAGKFQASAFMVNTGTGASSFIDGNISTYGSIAITGIHSGYVGIRFIDVGYSLLSSGVGGVGLGMLSTAGAWMFYISDGADIAARTTFWHSRQYMHMACTSTQTSGGIEFTNTALTLKGYVYWDAAGFGLLDSGGTWRVTVTTSGVALAGASSCNSTLSATDFILV